MLCCDSMALTYPLIMVSTRSQVSKTARVCQHEAFAKIIKEEGIRGLYSTAKQSGTLEAARKIFREEGVMGFFRGLFPALVLVINPVIQFTVYERLRIWWEKRIGRSLHAFDFFVLGALSKSLATSITYPYIVKSNHVCSSSRAVMLPRDILLWEMELGKLFGPKALLGYIWVSNPLLQSVLSAAFTFAFKEELFQSAMSLLVLLGVRATKSVN
ncbi:hypothetical protein BSLG_009567 [Batrachochytrium salamandrivorans]|nr:hypothetical protein BSLG_009567 [Batrachochytrium salamandrivorans]